MHKLDPLIEPASYDIIINQILKESRFLSSRADEDLEASGKYPDCHCQQCEDDQCSVRTMQLLMERK